MDGRAKEKVILLTGGSRKKKKNKSGCSRMVSFSAKRFCETLHELVWEQERL